MHLWLPMLLASVLAGAGIYGILARRNAVLVLVGVELVLNAANLLLVALGAVDTSPLQGLQTGQTLALFVITIAAAEICVALAIVLAMFRVTGHIDLTRDADTEDTDTEDTDTEDTDTDEVAPGETEPELADPQVTASSEGRDSGRARPQPAAGSAS